jgi:hypothetical protein
MPKPTDDAAPQDPPAGGAPQNPEAVIESMPSDPPQQPASEQDREGILP